MERYTKEEWDIMNEIFDDYIKETFQNALEYPSDASRFTEYVK